MGNGAPEALFFVAVAFFQFDHCLRVAGIPAYYAEGLPLGDDAVLFGFCLFEYFDGSVGQVWLSSFLSVGEEQWGGQVDDQQVDAGAAQSFFPLCGGGVERIVSFPIGGCAYFKESS